jgi:glucan 1,3-beta-glucosidase
MKLFKAALLSVFALGAWCKHFEIPEVENIVGNALKEFGDYVHFQGNHSEASAGTKRQSSTYWYETINHQGISAFGPSGYEVFRNVKDYGATGKFLSGELRKQDIY